MYITFVPHPIFRGKLYGHVFCGVRVFEVFVVNCFEIDFIWYENDYSVCSRFLRFFQDDFENDIGYLLVTLTAY